MRRAVFRRTSTGMALFPFLAVLICTMGSLIVLLVLVLQQSRVQASVATADARDAATTTNAAVSGRTAKPDAAAEQQSQELVQAKEDLEWRREMLATQREEQLENLSRMRKELSHLEDHVRRLEDQWKKLAEQAKQLQKMTDDKSDQSKATQDELEKLKAELEAKKKEVEEKKKKISTGPKSYALVPYVGKNGTRRRPIYIECAEVGIILHPEGVVFLPTDFQGPLGPGNPLDAALRTVREHWARQPDAASQGEPYPLLIVRPNGAVAYSMARAAMKTWEEEFGYELVEDSLELEFPPGDPELEALLARSIKDARSRQQVLAASMPSRYKSEGGGANGFAATPYEDETGAAPAGNRGAGGGFGGSAGATNGNANGGSFGAGGSAANGGSGANGAGMNGAGDLAGSLAPGGRGTGAGKGAGTGTGAGGFGFGGNSAAGGGANAAAVAGSGGGARGMNLDAGGGAPGSGGFNGVGGSGSGSGGMARGSGAGNSGGGSQAAGNPADFAAGGTGAGANAAAAAGGNQVAGGAPGAGGGSTAGGSSGGTAGGVAGPAGLGGGSAPAGASNGATMANADGGANRGADGQAGGAMQTAASRSSGGGSGFGSSSSGSNSSDGSGQASATFTPPSVARRRGQDWALRDKQQKATAITRPIRIRCLADRLVIVPERGDDQRLQVIPVQGDVNAALDPFVTAIWKQVDRWGLAVANGYWKPVLNVEVGPGAEANFQQLQVLLQGSGLEVVRK
ncbi:MAG: hypothetical protein U0939_03765 [Pirellulales bacterium]